MTTLTKWQLDETNLVETRVDKVDVVHPHAMVHLDHVCEANEAMVFTKITGASH